MVVSLVIPVLNEQDSLKKNFKCLEGLKKYAEIIFVDGGSMDGTVEVARGLGRVLKSRRGRAPQMNTGAKAANGNMLLFLHADCFLEGRAVEAARSALNNGAIGGCFTQRLTNERLVYRLIEGIGNRRARKDKIFYGDQGIFVKRDVFFSLGGFPDTPVMEDVLFSKALKALGRVEVLEDNIYASTRRWEKKGFLKTNLSYIFMMLLFYLHVPLPIIRSIYKDVR